MDLCIYGTGTECVEAGFLIFLFTLQKCCLCTLQKFNLCMGLLMSNTCMDLCIYIHTHTRTHTCGNVAAGLG